MPPPPMKVHYKEQTCRMFWWDV